MIIGKRKPKPVVKDPEIVTAGEARVGRMYHTAQSSSPDSKPVLVEVVGPNIRSGDIILRCWDPAYEEWRNNDVPKSYKLKSLKEGQVKIPKGPTATATKKSGNSPKAMGLTTHKNIYDTWGIAFKQFGTQPDAEKKIASFMEKEFPGRKTQFGKWVNNLRVRYNRGELGQPKPANPIPVYGSKREAKPKAKVTKKTAKGKK